MSATKVGIVTLFALLSIEANAKSVRPVFLTKEKQAEAAFHHRLVGAPARTRLQYFGGPVISNAKVYSVMWGANVNSDVQSRIGGMLSSTLASSFMDVLAQYRTNINSALGQPGTNQIIGRGTFGGSFTIQPQNASMDLQDSEVGAEIEGQIEAGMLPKPDANSLYFLYFPPALSITIEGAKSCEVFCGYHHSVKTRNYGVVYYSVQPDLGGACAMGCGFADTAFDNMTVITAHELAEAVTDPSVELNSDLGPPIAWVTDQGSEIGDLCASELTTLSAADGTTYNLQQAFDNSIGKCNKGPFIQR